MREGVELIRALWTEDQVAFGGTFYSAHGVIAPKPLQQPHPPLWIGGYREEMLDLTAELGHGWLPWNRSPETFAKKVEKLNAKALEHGRTDEIAYGAATLVLPDRMRDDDLVMSRGNMPNATPSTLTETVEAYAAAGATMFALFPFPATDALEIVRTFARQIIDRGPLVAA